MKIHIEKALIDNVANFLINWQTFLLKIENKIIIWNSKFLIWLYKKTNSFLLQSKINKKKCIYRIKLFKLIYYFYKR